MRSTKGSFSVLQIDTHIFTPTHPPVNNKRLQLIHHETSAKQWKYKNDDQTAFLTDWIQKQHTAFVDSCFAQSERWFEFSLEKQTEIFLPCIPWTFPLFLNVTMCMNENICMNYACVFVIEYDSVFLDSQVNTSSRRTISEWNCTRTLAHIRVDSPLWSRWDVSYYQLSTFHHSQIDALTRSVRNGCCLDAFIFYSNQNKRKRKYAQVQRTDK